MDATTARQLLQREQDELVRIARAEQAVVDDHDDEILDREADVTILQLVGERAGDIAHALRKVVAGTYGTCERCGRPISDARLRARPDARFCARDELVWERVIAPGREGGRDPGWRALALMDDEDELIEHVPMAAEEAAMHEELGDELEIT